MKHFKILLMAVLLIFTACSIEDTNAPENPGSVGKLTGIVLTADHTPVPDVLIRTEPTFEEVRTDKQGKFEIAGIPAGDYTVIAVKEGYKQATVEAKIAAGYKTAVIIILEEGGDENNPPEPPHSPEPEDEAFTTDTELMLKWQCSDPDGDPLKFDVYFSEENPPGKVAENIGDKSWAVENLKKGKTYFWKIVAKDDKGAATSGDIWTFTITEENQPPVKPYDPDPENQSEINVSEYTLSWECHDPDGDELFYDLYLGQADGQLINIARNLRTKHYFYKLFENNKTYIWKVVARDIHGAFTSSDIWTFTVKLNDNKPPVSPFNPIPANLAVVNKENVALSWQCYDPDGDPLTYDIYFAKGDGLLEPVAIGIDVREYHINGLDDKSSYQWKVVAKDNRGGESESRIWNFTTKFGNDDLMKDLLAYYPFDGNAKDKGPNRLNGKNMGAIPAFDRFNHLGKALFFGRGQEYVELPNPQIFAFKGDFTIAYWIKPNSDLCIPFETHIDVINKSDMQRNAWYTGFTTNMGPEFWVNNTFIGFDYIKLENQKWNHVAVVFRKNRGSANGIATIYLNGTQVGESKLISAPTNERNNVRIGDRPDKSSFGGSLDDIYFFNRALSGNEVMELMKID